MFSLLWVNFTTGPNFSFALLFRYSKWMLIDNLRRKGSRTAATKMKKRNTRYYENNSWRLFAVKNLQDRVVISVSQ